MIKLKKFQPELVVRAFPERELRENPNQINKGLCMRWAYMAYLMFENIELWSTCGHAFIKVGNKFYDSETLQGEEDWKDLPACNFGACGCANKGPFVFKKLKSFQRFWNKNSRTKPDWKQYWEEVKNELVH